MLIAIISLRSRVEYDRIRVDHHQKKQGFLNTLSCLNIQSKIVSWTQKLNRLLKSNKMTKQGGSPKFQKSKLEMEVANHSANYQEIAKA